MSQDDISAKAKRLFSVFKNNKTDDLIDLILNKNFTIQQLTTISDLGIK